MDHPVEQKYPRQTAAWKKIDEDSYKVHLEKNSDYSPSNVLYSGMPGIMVRLWDKVARIFNLFGVPFPNFVEVLNTQKKELIQELVKFGSNNSGNIIFGRETLESIINKHFDIMEERSTIDFTKFLEKEPENESVLDNLKDLRSYAQIATVYYMGEWGR